MQDRGQRVDYGRLDPRRVTLFPSEVLRTVTSAGNSSPASIAVGAPIMKNRKAKTSGDTILIACPIPDLCEQWCKVLEPDFRVEILAGGTVLTQYVMNLRPSILLLDLSLPELGGVQVIPILRSLSPVTDIILLTPSLDPEEAVSVLKRGVKGYCDRYVSPSLVQKAVELVQKGEIWVPRSVLPALLAEMAFLAERRRDEARTKSGTYMLQLTAGEHRVSQLIADGLSNKQIALRLSISDKTVKTHLTTIYRKLEISDRLQLALLVATHRSNKSSVGERDAGLPQEL
jgi:DNA-binding NarL/FixJ family response regulator